MEPQLLKFWDGGVYRYGLYRPEGTAHPVMRRLDRGAQLVSSWVVPHDIPAAQHSTHEEEPRLLELDLAADMYSPMPTSAGMCAGTCVDMCAGTCVDTCAGTCVGMCADTPVDMFVFVFDP